MKQRLPLLLLPLLLAACSSAEAPLRTVEELATQPERLKELRERCRLDHAKMGDTLCVRVAKAT